MTSYNFIFLALVFFISISFSCKNKNSIIEGEWRIDYSSYQNPIFERIIFSDSSIRIFDLNRVEYNYEPNKISEILTLVNQYDTLFLPLNTYDDSLIISDQRYLRVKEVQKFDDLHIKLLNIPNKPIYPTFSKSHRDYFITLDKSYENELILIMGDKFAKINEISSFLQCHHCKGKPNVFLLINESTTYKELLKVYKWLRFSGVLKIGIITNSLHPNEYQGFYDPLYFWEEDIVEFSNKNQLPPLPPIQSKKGFIKEVKNLSVIENMNTDKIDLFKNKYTAGDSAILISMNNQIQINEYISTVSEIQNHILSILNKKSIELYETEFKNLNAKDKSKLKNLLPTVIIERN